MLETNLMPKIKACDRCHFFLHSPYLVCGINPSGPEGEICEDFKALEQPFLGKIAEVEAENQPLGGGYSGDWVPQPFPAIATDRQFALLDWYSQFTGRCPKCEMLIAEAEEGEGHWKCDHCDWKGTTAHAQD